MWAVGSECNWCRLPSSAGSSISRTPAQPDAEVRIDSAVLSVLSSARRLWCCAILDSRVLHSDVQSLCTNVIDADGREETVLYTIAVVLFILWLLGLVGGYTVGAFIHVLLVIALVLVVVQFMSGRRVV
jgi:Family of unknown function (DUF5670)